MNPSASLPCVLSQSAVAPSGAWPNDVRGRLMLTMAEVAGQRGYASTRVQHVLERARVSRRTFYVHFHNREECFFAAYDAVIADIDRVLSADEPTVRKLIVNLLDYFAQWPAHARLAMIEAFSAGPEGRARHEEVVSLVAARLADCEPWQPGDCAGLEREEMAQATVGAMLRMIQHRLLTGQPEMLPELAPTLVALTTRVRVAADRPSA